MHYLHFYICLPSLLLRVLAQSACCGASMPCAIGCFELMGVVLQLFGMAAIQRSVAQ